MEKFNTIKVLHFQVKLKKGDVLVDFFLWNRIEIIYASDVLIDQYNIKEHTIPRSG